MSKFQCSLLTVSLFGIISYPDISFGLGINCRGSSTCGVVEGSIATLTNNVCSLPGFFKYAPGQRITYYCDRFAGGLAVFTQNTSSNLSARNACSLLKRLQNHGCKKCGSIPLAFPGSNDVSKGQLTVNYVAHC